MLRILSTVSLAMSLLRLVFLPADKSSAQSSLRRIPGVGERGALKSAEMLRKAEEMLQQLYGDVST